MIKATELLVEAKSLIEDPKNWTTGWFAKQEDGSIADSCDKYAVCFCSLGALERVYGVHTDNDQEGIGEAMYQARCALDSVMHSDVPGYNDGHTHAEVMSKWDEAIELVRTEEVSK